MSHSQVIASSKSVKPIQTDINPFFKREISKKPQRSFFSKVIEASYNKVFRKFFKKKI